MSFGIFLMMLPIPPAGSKPYIVSMFSSLVKVHIIFDNLLGVRKLFWQLLIVYWACFLSRVYITIYLFISFTLPLPFKFPNPWKLLFILSLLFISFFNVFTSYLRVFISCSISSFVFFGFYFVVVLPSIFISA